MFIFLWSLGLPEPPKTVEEQNKKKRQTFEQENRKFANNARARSRVQRHKNAIKNERLLLMHSRFVWVADVCLATHHNRDRSIVFGSRNWIVRTKKKTSVCSTSSSYMLANAPTAQNSALTSMPKKTAHTHEKLPYFVCANLSICWLIGYAYSLSSLMCPDPEV